MKRVAIVGVGLIGGSLGLALRERCEAHVVGVGRSAARLEKAQSLGAVDTFTTDLAEGVAEADMVVLATPIPQILSDIERLPALLSSHTVVTDAGSTKATIAAVGARLLPTSFVPSHPMAGSEKSGVEASRSDLFTGATWAITPTETVTAEAVAQVRTLAEAVGARVLFLPPEEHDQLVALTSHLPHVLAFALMRLANQQATHSPTLFDLAAGAFASATRVARSDPALWRDICHDNRVALTEALRQFEAELARARTLLSDADAFEAYLRGNAPG